MSGRETGQTKSSGFQAGARATLTVSTRRLWAFIVSEEGQALLGAAPMALTKESEGVTAFIEGSHYRRRVQDGNGRGWLLQVRVLEASGGRSTLALHAENLPGAEEREKILTRFHGSIEKIRALGGSIDRN